MQNGKMNVSIKYVLQTNPPQIQNLANVQMDFMNTIADELALLKKDNHLTSETEAEACIQVAEEDGNICENSRETNNDLNKEQYLMFELHHHLLPLLFPENS